MGGNVLWILLKWAVPYFHKPQASENTAHECNVLPYYTTSPLNDVFILYSVFQL